MRKRYIKPALAPGRPAVPLASRPRAPIPTSGESGSSPLVITPIVRSAELPALPSPVDAPKKKARKPINYSLSQEQLDTYTDNPHCIGMHDFEAIKAKRKPVFLENGKFAVLKSGPKYYKVTKPKSNAPIYCNCPAWIFQKEPSNMRTCKHCAVFVSTYDPTLEIEKCLPPPEVLQTEDFQSTLYCIRISVGRYRTDVPGMMRKSQIVAMARDWGIATDARKQVIVERILAAVDASLAADASIARLLSKLRPYTTSCLSIYI